VERLKGAGKSLGIRQFFSSAGVEINRRVVGAVTVAVEALGAGRGQHGIRLGESADLGVVVTPV